MMMPGYETEGFKMVNTHNVIEKSYWNVNLVQMQQSGKDPIMCDGFKAAIDSGTSLIVGPNSLVEPLIEGINVEKDCSNMSELPDITFTFDETPYVLESSDYVVQVSNGKQT